MNDRIMQLLDLAILAPSGDNCQPWRFAVRGNRVDLWNDPSADTSYYNYRQRASLVAHGAALENIVTGAPSYGLRTCIVAFPVTDEPDLIATITFEECLPTNTPPRLNAIRQRTTNRKTYSGVRLAEAQLERLQVHCDDLPKVSVFLTTQDDELKKLAKVICLSDRLVFENRLLHDFLYEHIRWTEEEAARTRDGLDIRTLELAPMDALGFRLLGSWSVASLLGKLGATRAVADNARRLAHSAAAIGIILGDGSGDSATYLAGGRLLQRIWLQATAMDLAFHPMTGISFLMQRVAEGAATELSPHHARLLEEARQSVATTCGVSRTEIIAIFRVGFADPPRTRSLRRELSQVVF